MKVFNRRKNFQLSKVRLPIGFEFRTEQSEFDGEVGYIYKIHEWHGGYRPLPRKMFRESKRGIITHKVGMREYPYAHINILKQLNMQLGTERTYYWHLEDK